MRQFSPPMDVTCASPIEPRRGPEDFGLPHGTLEPWNLGTMEPWNHGTVLRVDTQLGRTYYPIGLEFRRRETRYATAKRF